LRAGDEPGVRAIAAGERTVYGPLVRAILETPPHDALSIELVERFRPTFERFTTWLSATITAAPLLGILGSVSGIIRSLGLMSKAGHVSSVDGAVAGIAEALIATAFGLSVALITLFPYVLCRAHTDRAIGHMELLVAAWSGGRAKSKVSG
jgi:biopolymer transport protein ExbB